MKKFVILFLLCFIWSVLAACSVPLEGIGVKPETVKDIHLSGENRSLTVSWDKVYLADSYSVYYSEEQNIPAKPYAVVKEPSVTIPDLLNDVTYYVWVASSNKMGTLVPKNIFSGTIPLSVPTGVSLRKIAIDTIEASWAPVDLAEEYEIFCKTSQISPNTTDTPDQTVSDNSAILSGLDQLFYCVWVRAKNSRGISALSEMAQVSFVLSAPEGVSLRKTAGDTLEASWSPVDLADEYEVFCKTSPIPPNISDTPNQTVSQTYAILSGLDQPVYYIWVRAKNSRGKSTLSEMVQDSFAVPDFRVSVVGDTWATLAWNPLDGASGYNVYRSGSENGSYTKINTNEVIDTRYTNTGLTTLATYYYRVSAVIGGTESIKSSPVFASTGRSVPGNDLAAKLNWLKNNAVSNTLYGIEVNTNENLAPYNILSYSGKSGITIVLRGSGAMRTIRLSDFGALFAIHSDVTLILDSNITLSGLIGNEGFLVYTVGGTMIMNEGSKITGNSGGVQVNNGNFIMNGGEISNNHLMSGERWGGGVCVFGTFTMNGGKISGNTASLGGGVYVTGTFIMNGGEISGNTASSGGGVYVDDGLFYIAPSSNPYYRNVLFQMSGGVIYGSNAVTGLRNTASKSGTALHKENRSNIVALYGTFSGNTFIRRGDLNTTNTTIRIVNGDLLTE